MQRKKQLKKKKKLTSSSYVPKGCFAGFDIVRL